MRPRRQNAPFDFLMVCAYDQRGVPSGVLDCELDRLDKSPTFVRYPANWMGEARLLHRVPILDNRQDRRSGTKDSGCSDNSFYNLASVHTRQEFPFWRVSNRTNRAQVSNRSVCVPEISMCRGTKCTSRVVDSTDVRV